ncbi:MAG: carboxypeptidase-like regulatory domain-containing protein, partial [Bacteroidota bacterium]|nr:carboxypeptidase-like regulatory domain-containing protein [Bacteroidota bacterium]
MKKQIILIVAFLSMFGVLFAQTAHDITPNYAGVTGRVSDSSGNPLIGASVSVKGTSHGSVTGVDGKFTLSNVPKDAILHVSYMGYVSTDIPVNSSSLAIVLKEEVKKIDE